MKISPHFTLAEATKTSQPYDNQPDTDEDLATIQRTAQKLERIRELLNNNPVIINSWYRSTAVNNAVGGVPTSQHKLGEAVDFVCPKFGSIKDIIKTIRDNAGELQYDQLILEPTWVHISFCTSRRNRDRQPRLQYLDYSNR